MENSIVIELKINSPGFSSAESYFVSIASEATAVEVISEITEGLKLPSKTADQGISICYFIRRNGEKHLMESNQNIFEDGVLQGDILFIEGTNKLNEMFLTSSSNLSETATERQQDLLKWLPLLRKLAEQLRLDFIAGRYRAPLDPEAILVSFSETHTPFYLIYPAPSIFVASADSTTIASEKSAQEAIILELSRLSYYILTGKPLPYSPDDVNTDLPGLLEYVNKELNNFEPRLIEIICRGLLPNREKYYPEPEDFFKFIMGTKTWFQPKGATEVNPSGWRSLGIDIPYSDPNEKKVEPASDFVWKQLTD